MTMSYGELRAVVADEELAWMPPAGPAEEEDVTQFGLGADPDGALPDEQAPPLQLRELGTSTNPYLSVRRAERGLVTPDQVRAVFPERLLQRLGLGDALDEAVDGEGTAPDAGAPPSVDWRSRWGQNWLTSTRDQNGCNACWAFTGVALVESMVRIEHAMWTRLSEGDPHRGVGKACPDLGNMGEVSTFFAANGLCDPGSWPWQTASPPYAPTPDRNGRSVRGPAFTSVSVADPKNWLDTVGPLAASSASTTTSAVWDRVSTDVRLPRPTPCEAATCS